MTITLFLDRLPLSLDTRNISTLLFRVSGDYFNSLFTHGSLSSCLTRQYQQGLWKGQKSGTFLRKIANSWGFITFLSHAEDY